MPARYIIMALWALALFCLAIAWTFSARAETKSEWFRSLTVPGTTNSSCCSEADCLPTKAENRGGEWWADVNGTMRPVPADRIVRNQTSYDGRAYVCVWNGVILCFVRPGAGS